MIRIENVSKYYFSKKNVVLALNNISLELKKGEFVAITGKSGSGKSTLLNVISGLDSYEKGKMFVDGKDVTYYNQSDFEEYRKEKIAFIFQRYNIVESYTVFENVEMALIVKGFNKTTRKEKVLDILKKVGLEEQQNQKAGLLSGGQMQRTAIARALAKDCDTLICDEPTGNLDVENSKLVYQLLSEISKEKLVIVVSHSYEEIKPYITRKIRLYDGEVVEDTSFVTNTEVINKVELKKHHIRRGDIYSVAFKNLISVPKKTLFTVIVLSFMTAMLMFSYGLNIKAKSTFDSGESSSFRNVTSNRIIVTNDDYSMISDTQISEIKNIRFVRGVIDNDIVLDTMLVSTHLNDETGNVEFLEYKINAAIGLDSSDLVKGRMPRASNEIVIGENEIYDVGSIVYASDDNVIKRWQDARLDDYRFTVVGVVDSKLGNQKLEIDMYLSFDGLESLKVSALYKYADVKLIVDESKEYLFYEYIRVDDNLDDDVVLAYDMFFFDICHDVGFVSPPGMKVLCPVDEWLLPDHTFKLASATAFNNQKEAFDVVMTSVESVEHQFGRALYVNTKTYLKLFDDGRYQISVIVADNYDGRKVRDSLVELGYNVLYPNEILDQRTAYNIFYRNIQYDAALYLVIIVSFLVGYAVIQGIMYSKKETYIIYRSLGSTKRTITRIITFEMIVQMLVSIVVVTLSFAMLEGNYSDFPRVLKYFNAGSYMGFVVLIMILLVVMSLLFSRNIYKESVISSFRMR